MKFDKLTSIAAHLLLVPLIFGKFIELFSGTVYSHSMEWNIDPINGTQKMCMEFMFLS